MPGLDVGAAYGNASYPALEAGGTVIACDFAEEELARLRGPVPPDMQKRLITLAARFPEELHFTSGSLSAILAAQVLHFFDGGRSISARSCFPVARIGRRKALLGRHDATAQLLHKIPPGISAPKKGGDPWPGTFDPRLVATPEWRDKLPHLVNLFDADILRRAVNEAGFAIEHLEPFCYKDFPEKHRTNGEEFLGLIARKP